jgi:hypothetical protein
VNRTQGIFTDDTVESLGTAQLVKDKVVYTESFQQKLAGDRRKKRYFYALKIKYEKAVFCILKKHIFC